MRISSLQIYRQGVESMQFQQSKLQQTELQLASGLRIMKPSDDPASAVKILDLNSNIQVIEQFSRNASAAESALAFEENVIAGVNNNLQRVRELTIQGNNSSNSASDRESIAQEIYQRLDELISFSNTRDSNGDYIFGGYKVDTPPFINNAGTVSYQGDQGQRFIQVGEGSKVAVGDSGENVFQRIKSGDGDINVQASASNTGTGVVGGFGINGNFIPDTYDVTFTQVLPSDPVTYTVTDSSAATVSTGLYNDGSSISFAGIQFNYSGTPANGDVVTVSPSVNSDIFSAVKSIADGLSGTGPLPADIARFHNEMAQGIASLDQGINKMSSIRAGIGSRMNNLETIENINEDFKLQLETVRSETQDLDFAEAISRFNLQLTSLQAAQQAFVKTSGLTLFQYI